MTELVGHCSCRVQGRKPTSPATDYRLLFTRLSVAQEDAGGEVPALVACSGSYACWAPEGSCSVQVTQLSSQPSQPLLLACGDSPITAISLGTAVMGTSDPLPELRASLAEQLLVTATKDAVLVWRLQQTFAAAAAGQHMPPAIQALNSPGHVTSMVLCSTSNRLAVCAGTAVHVIGTTSLKHVYRLQGSHGCVLAACFCAPHQPDWLLTAGDDRCYRLWDLHEGGLLYESPVLCASPIVAAAIDPSYFRCALGAADGVVRFFDLSACPAVRCLQVLDIAQHVTSVRCNVQASVAAAAAAAKAVAGPKVLCAARGKLSHGKSQPDEEVQMDLSQEASFPEVFCGDGVLCLAYSQLRSGAYQGNSGLLGESPKLLVGLMRCLAIVDTHSYEVLQLHVYRGAGISLSAITNGVQVTSSRCSLHALQDVEVPAAYSFALASHEQYMYCCCGAANSSDVYILSCTPTASTGAATREAAAYTNQYLPGIADAADPAGKVGPAEPTPPCASHLHASTCLSVFATKPLPADSPLMAALRRGCSSSGDQRLQHASVRRASEGVLCMPHPGLPPCSQRACSADSSTCARATGKHTIAVSQHGSNSSSSNSSSNSNSSNSSTCNTCMPLLPHSSSGGLPGRGSSGLTKRISAPATLTGNAPVARPLRPHASSQAASPTKPKVKPPPDKPVTFHRQIKSSGYGMLQPSMKLGRPPPPPIKLNTRPTPTNQVAKQLRAARQYPCDGDAPVVLQPYERTAHGPQVHHAAILSLRYSGDGSRLLTASADKSARVLRMPLAKHQGAGTDLLGHNAAVHHVSWNQDSTMLLTASADRTARLWHAGCAQPLLVLSHMQRQQHSIKAMKHADSQPVMSSSPVTNKNPAFLHEIVAAQFFYLDKFIMLASGNKMHLYSFDLPDYDPKDDLARMSSHHTYARVSGWSSTAQTITAMSTVNVLQSPLVLLANSGRCVEVLDCTTMQQAACLTDVHSRAPHTLIQAAGCSLFTSHPREAQELFATSATDGQLKIWDLRTCQCVRTLSGHKNSQIRVGAAFSPCLRYIASGSEDQATHVYDLRQGSLLHRMRENTDAITDVAFNPVTPQLAAASLTGCLHLYGPY